MKKRFVTLLIVLFFIKCQSVKIKGDFVNSFYVGTYTNGKSEGIYKLQVKSNGRLSKVGLVAKTNNPSFLAKTKDNATLLAVNETDSKGSGFVKSYKIKNDTLLFVSKSKSGGAHPCFITVNDKNKVLVANYSGGNVGYLNIDDQSGLTNLLDVQQHIGKGTTNRQNAPHAHSVWFHPTKKEIISVDLGTNELWFSKIDDERKKFVFTNQKKLKLVDGAGPRHLTFHPNNKWIYVLNELNNTVSLINESGGNYFLENSISMLPKGFTEFSKGADIHISNDGKFLYASNRGHNTIVIYKVNPKKGYLTLVGFEKVKGKNPRSFSLTPNNKYLLVANQDTNNIISFKRDFVTGKLTFVSEISVPNPVCILF